MWLLLPASILPCPAVWEDPSSPPKYLHYPFGMWHCRWTGRQRREALIFPKSALILMHRGGEGWVSRALSLQMKQWAKQGKGALGGTRYRAEQRGDKRDHGEEKIMGEWGMQNSTCYGRGGSRGKKNPLCLLRFLQIPACSNMGSSFREQSGWQRRRRCLEKCLFTLMPWNRKKLACKCIFLKVFLQTLSARALSTRCGDYKGFLTLCTPRFIVECLQRV